MRNDFIMGQYFAFWLRQEAYGKGETGVQLKTDPNDKSTFLCGAGAEEVANIHHFWFENFPFLPVTTFNFDHF